MILLSKYYYTLVNRKEASTQKKIYVYKAWDVLFSRSYK